MNFLSYLCTWRPLFCIISLSIPICGDIWASKYHSEEWQRFLKIILMFAAILPRFWPILTLFWALTSRKLANFQFYDHFYPSAIHINAPNPARSKIWTMRSVNVGIPYQTNFRRTKLTKILAWCPSQTFVQHYCFT